MVYVGVAVVLQKAITHYYRAAVVRKTRKGQISESECIYTRNLQQNECSSSKLQTKKEKMVKLLQLLLKCKQLFCWW